MKYEIDQATDILRRTPSILREMLQGLDEPWVMNNYGEKTFSPFDVVGHLLHCERSDWMVRVRILLEHGEDRPFDAYDRYAMYEASQGKSMVNLLDEFDKARKANLNELRAMDLDSEQLSLKGTHPIFGPVELGQLLATWVTHDLHYIAQICKAMSYQYKDEIGPWIKFIGIVPR